MQPTAVDRTASPFLADATPLTDYREVEEILGSHSVRMLRSTTELPFMHDALPLLEGLEHTARRRQLAALFRPTVLRETHDPMIREAVRRTFGRIEVPPTTASDDSTITVDACLLAQQIHVLVLARFVGLDAVWETTEGREAFERATGSINAAVSMRWSLRDPIEESASIRSDITDFTQHVLLPALRARRDRADAGAHDLLAVLARLHDSDETDWDGELIIREAVAFLAGGIQSSSNAVVDSLSEILPWLQNDSTPLDRLRDPNDDLLWRCVAESLRLHPSNPALNRIALEDFTLKTTGRRIKKGEELAVHTGLAARDPAVFGPDADEFNPFRTPIAGVPLEAWVFGSGHHACIGRALALGRRGPSGVLGIEGSVVTATRAFLNAGANQDPGSPPTYRQDTAKRVIASLRIRLNARAVRHLAAGARGQPSARTR